MIAAAAKRRPGHDRRITFGHAEYHVIGFAPRISYPLPLCARRYLEDDAGKSCPLQDVDRQPNDGPDRKGHVLRSRTEYARGERRWQQQQQGNQDQRVLHRTESVKLDRQFS